MPESEKYYFEVSINGIGDIFRIFMLSEKYVFRGHKDYSWCLATTFERAVSAVDNKSWGELEEKIILEFKRRAHHYISDLPQSEVEWLALMQHHGSPTRLLDFTRSFLIALYFAVENASCDSAVWAIDTSYFIKRPEPVWKDHLLSTYCKDAEDEVNQILKNSESSKSGIIFVEPFKQNQRLAIQKGVFAFSKNIQKSFGENTVENLKSFKQDHESDSPKYVAQKIRIPKKYHIEIITLLDRMNINSATLFPGLDGYAKSQINHINIAQHHENILGEALRDAMESMVSSYSSESSSEPEDEGG